MPVLLILRTPGDPVELEKIYTEEKAALTGLDGRGEDWGIPHVVLSHICAFSDDAMYHFDVFKDEETLRNLIQNPQNLPPHLRPVSPGQQLDVRTDGYRAAT